MLNKLSIKAQMAILFILATVLMILMSNIALYFIFNNIIRGQLMQDLDNIMSQSSWNMDTFVNSINQASLYLCTDKSTADALNTKQNDPIEYAASINTMSGEVANHISIPLNGVLTNYEYYFFVSEKLPLAQYMSPLYNFTLAGSGLRNASGASGTEWYQSTKKLGGSFHVFMITKENNQKSLVLARAVSSPYLINNDLPDGFLGEMVFSFDVSQIWQQIRSAQITNSTKLFLVGSDGKILFAKDESYLEKNITDYIPSGVIEGYGSKRMVNLALGGKKYITSINDLKYGWHLIAMIPSADIAERLSPVRNTIFITTIIAASFGVLLSLLFSISFTKPIKKLALAMKSVKSEEYFNIFIEPPSGNEVGMLYDSFNSMMKRINKLLDEVYHSVLLQKEAERKALQAQINPHFLYNTLDAVNWLALGDGEETIASVISSLANIMRFNIRNLDKLATISEELENVKNYVSIQSTCHADNFDIQYDLPHEILSRKCPALTLQPLVENAIIYGVEKISERGMIRIEGAVEGDILLISVINNGPGADVDELNAYLEGKQTLLKNSDGLGIKNVNQRIKLHFGEQFGLRYSITADNRIIASVTLPFHQENIAETGSTNKPQT